MDDMLAGMPKSQDLAVREYLEGVNGPFAGMISNLVTGDGSQSKGLFGMLGGLMGGKLMMTSNFDGKPMVVGASGADPRPVAAPASEAEIAASEEKLGFALPAGLRQFYVEIANGGVGPGNGIYSLAELVAKHREMTGQAPGPQGHPWPANLLPIQGDDWDIVAIDRGSGRLIFWDVEDIDDESEDPNEPTWAASFVAEADSLEQWLAKWLDRPSVAEQMKRDAEQPAPSQLTDADWEAWGNKDPINREYLKRIDIATMTPAERAGIGLTEDNWAEKMREGLDLASITFPTPGYAERQGGDE